MFLKRLSSALCAILCFGGFVLGTNITSQPNAVSELEESSLAAPLALGATLISSNISCYDEDDGSIAVTVTNGQAPFVWELWNTTGVLIDNGSTPLVNFTINNISPGEYRVVINDNSISPPWTSAIQTYNEPAEIKVSLVSIDPIQCNGGMGAMSFSASGDNAISSYSALSTTTINSPNGVFINIPEGNYNVWATDNKNCTAYYTGTTSLNFNEPILLNPVVNETQIPCFGETGTAKVDGLPENVGVNAFKIELKNTTTGSTAYSYVPDEYLFTGLDAGDYELKVWRDGCMPVTRQFEIYNVSDITINESVVGTINCYGETVSVNVTVGGGKAGKNFNVLLIDALGNSVSSPLLVYGSTHEFTYANEGIYTIKVIDEEVPSCIKTKSIDVPGPNSPLVYTSTPTKNEDACYNEANGTLNINVSGGQIPYTYHVGANTYTAVSSILLAADDYEVYVSDQNGCETPHVTITIEESDQLLMSVQTALTQQLTCVDGNDARIYVKTTGGRAPYLYTVLKDGTPIITDQQSNDSIQSFPGLEAGDYEIQVKDAFCAALVSDFEEIIQVDPIYVDILRTPELVTCRDEETMLFVRAAGGIVGQRFTYSLFKNGVFVESRIEDAYADGQSFGTSLTPGNYTVWISYNDVCDSISEDIRIYNPRQFTVNYPDTVRLDCFDEPATAKITASGEYGFFYSLDNGVNYEAFTGNNGGAVTVQDLAQGNNSVLFKDNKGCVYNDGTPVNIYVDEPEAINVELINSTTPQSSCNGASDAEVLLQLTGGSAPFEVEVLNSLQPAKTTDNDGLVTFSLPAGDSYNVRVLDINNGCDIQQDDVFDVIEPDAFVISSIEIVTPDLACFGDSTRIKVNVEGGWGGDTEITVQGGGKTTTLPPSGVAFLKGGDYRINAVSEYGCTADTTITINQPAKIVLSSIVKQDVSCNGSNDATITFNTAGGTSPYYWGLAGAASPSNEFTTVPYTIDTDLTAGDYQLIVGDVNGCVSEIHDVTIEELEPVTFTVENVDSVECYGGNNGSIVLNASGGTGVYKYSYTFEGTTSELQLSNELRDLFAGEYIIHVEDMNLCPAEEQNETVGQPTEIQILSAVIDSQISCYGYNDAIISIDAIGGAPYGLQYKVTGRPYQSENEIIDLGNGLYDIYVSDKRGLCETKWVGGPLNIPDPDELGLLDPTITDVSCSNFEDGAVQINATGGTGTYTFYLYENGSLKGSPQAVGEFTKLGGINTNTVQSLDKSYTIEVRDNNGCTASRQLTINNPARLNISELDHEQVTCNDDGDGWVKVNVTGGRGSYTFKKHYANTFTNDIDTVNSSTYVIQKYSGGIYQPMVMDLSFCTDTIPLDAQIEIINPPLVEFTDPIDWGVKKCNGDDNDSTIIHATGGTGGLFYSVDNGVNYGGLNDSLFIGLPKGPKFPLIKDVNGCTKTGEEYSLDEPDALEVDYEFFDIQCSYDEFGDVELKLVGGTENYFLSINDPNFGTDVTTIDRDAVEDTTTFSFLENGIELEPNKTFYFYLRDENNCPIKNIAGVKSFTDAFADTIFTIPEELILESLKQIPVKCSGENTGIIEFTASGGTVTPTSGYTLTAYHVGRKYEKVNSLNFMSVGDLFAGLHHLYLTDANGCEATTRLTAAGFGYDTISVAAENRSINLAVSSIGLPECNRTYDGWLEVDIADYLEEGAVTEVAYFDSAINEYVSFQYDSVQASSDYVDVQGSNFLYYADAKLVADYFGIGSYRVNVTDNQSGCTTKLDTVILSVNGDSCPPFNYYNAFTPHNNDSFNEEWIIHGSRNQKFMLQIYTAFGELVYSDDGTSADEGIRWNGLDTKGRPVPVGTYIYLLSKDIGTPSETTINGNISIIRGNGK